MLSGKSRSKTMLSDVSIFVSDIPALLEQLKDEEGWINGKRGAMTLVKNENLSVVLVALRPGAAIHAHEVGGPMSLQVVEGQIRFSTDFESVNLEKDELVALKSGIRHKVEALEECAFLLTIGGSARISSSL